MTETLLLRDAFSELLRKEMGLFLLRLSREEVRLRNPLIGNL